MRSIIRDKFQDNWIVLDVENINSTSDSFIDLFDIQSNYAQGSTLYQAVVKVGGSPFIQVVYNGGKVKNIYATINTIDDLLEALNEAFPENANSLFFNGGKLGAATYSLECYSSKYTFTSILLNGLNLFTATAGQNAVGGTSINVNSESVVSWNEVVQELVFQPYKIDNMDVFANTLAQANNQIWKATKMANGVEYDDYSQPAVNPIQNQFALIYIPLNFTPSATNGLIYKVDAGESVRIIMRYSRISLNQIKEIQVSEIDDYDILTLPRFNKPSGKLVDLVNQELRKDIEKKFIERNKSETGIKAIVSGYLFSGKA